MKKICVVLLVIILAFAVVSCKKEETDIPDGMFLVENEAAYYDLYLPEGWVVDRNDGMISAHASSTDVGSNISVTSIAVPSGYDNYREYIDKGMTEHYKSTFPDMQIIEEFTETELDGKSALKTVFTATVGGTEYQFEQVVTTGEKLEVFVFTYTSTPELFDTHKEEVERILNELKFH